MTLGKLLTQFGCTFAAAPKSPTPPNSPNAVREFRHNQEQKDDHVAEVTPCMDMTNAPITPSPAAADKKTGIKSKTVDKAPEASSDAGSAAPKAKLVTVTEASKDELDNLILNVFGFDVLHQSQGKSWEERGQAVQAVRARVLQADFGGSVKDEFFKASCAVARVALNDKVMPVFFDGLDLAKLLLGDFVAKESFEADILTKEVNSMVAIVVNKTSDRNARSIEATRQAIIFFAKQPHIGCSQVMSHILAPIANTKEVGSIRGRLELLEHIMGEFGLSKNSGGLSLSGIMTFTRAHLEAADEKVRRAAVEVTVSCYKLKGDRTMKYCANLKPVLLKLLEQRFNEVDKKAGSKTEKKASRASRARKPLARNNGFTGGQVPELVPNKAPLKAPPALKAPTAPLAPLDIGNHDKANTPKKQADSRQFDISLPSSSKLASVDIFASDLLQDEPLVSPFMTSPKERANDANPNFIPSPTTDENLMDGLMDEIEAF